MNLQQAKIILEKINRLYKSMTLDEKNIDVFEQDLMLSYVKQLYDAFAPEEQQEPIRKTIPRRARPVIKEVARPVEVAPEPEPAKVVQEETPAPVSPPPPPPPKPKAKPEHEVLFEQKEAKELSEKLSSQPIKDLNKAMGINEKILTINELFSKDDSAYKTAVKQLNVLKSFEEAKPILSELAEKHNWTQRNKKKKAQVFIKLVRRRYL